MKKRIIALLLALFSAFCFAFVSCDNEEEVPKTDEQLILERIDTFVNAYNDGDWETTIGCFDNKTRKTVEALFNVLGGVAGSLTGINLSLSDLFTLGIVTTGEDWLTVSIDDIDIISSTTAVVSGKMSINNGYSTEYSAAYFYMLKENGDWFVQDLKDKYSGGSSNQNSSSGSSESSEEIGGGESITTSIYEIETCSPFKDGRAWVSYEDNQYTYKGFINTQGKILYSERSDEQNTYNIGKGSGLIVTEEACKLINANGEVALTIEGKVEIKAYGGGYAWIYQNKSTITSLEHLYGVVNYQGEWAKPFENLYEKGVYDKIRYVGNGFVGEIGRNSIEYSIYNGDNSVAITLNGVFSDWHIKFSNGIAFVPKSCHATHLSAVKDGISITITKRDENGQILTEVYNNIKENCIIYEDGRVVNIGYFIASLNYDWAFYEGKVITQGNGQYFQITDYTKTTPITTEFTAYPAAQIEDFVFNGDYGLVQIRGLDNERYVTMIDTQGNELIEPIKEMRLYDCTLAPEGYLYYKQNGYYHIIDKNGNEKKTDITWFVNFDEEIGVVENYYYGLYYIKPNGEKLFDTLSKGN